MLFSVIGELRVGISPRRVRATRLILCKEQLRGTARNGEQP